MLQSAVRFARRAELNELDGTRPNRNTKILGGDWLL